MAVTTTELLNTGQIKSSSPVGRRMVRWFFPVVCGLLLAGVFIGFAKTFFLRSQFNVPPMPRYLYVHGIVLTTWFALVLAQTGLVAARRTDLHRRLGIATAIIAVLVIPISAFVIAHAAQRARTITPLLRLEVVGDCFSLIWFAGFVAGGLYFRGRPDVHKRLMIASCFTIYGPVFARFQLVYGLPVPPPVVVLLGPLVLGTFDLIAARRLHRATVWIGLFWLGGLLPLLGVVLTSGAADTIIRALR